jgi:hypothetical protein
MSDSFQSVVPGQRLKVPAATWNAMLAAAQSHVQSQFDVKPSTAGDVRSPALAKVRNTTASTLDRFSIVGIAAPVVLPDNSPWEFARQTAVDVTLPMDGRFAVLLEPLASGAIGSAAVAGVVPVRLSVSDQPYEAATIIPGEPDHLQNVPHGPARILWMEASGSIRWAIVRIDDSNYEEIVYITSNIADSNGYYPAVVQRYDPQSRTWVSQYPCKVVDANR